MKVELRNISFAYRSRQGRRHVFADLSLQIDHGEAVGILGSEGSGKSTLLQIIDGLRRPDAGSVLIDGANPWLSKESWREIRHKVGYLFQFPEQQFFNESVGKELTFELNNLGMTGNHDAACHECLALVGMSPDRLMHLSPFSLSIGEARRVALAASLITKRDILLLDEPTAGLDANGIASVTDVVRKVNKQGCGIVLVSHDVDVLAACVSRIVVLSKGVLAFDGLSDNILRDEALLADNGYNLPQVERCRRMLREKGVKLDERLYAEEELVQVVEQTIMNRPT